MSVEVLFVYLAVYVLFIAPYFWAGLYRRTVKGSSPWFLRLIGVVHLLLAAVVAGQLLVFLGEYGTRPPSEIPWGDFFTAFPKAWLATLLLYFLGAGLLRPRTPPAEVTADDINPWLSIWYRPAQTIRHIVTAGGRKWEVLIATLAGVFAVEEYLFAERVVRLDEQFDSFLVTLAVKLAVELVLGLIFGNIGLAILSFVLHIGSKVVGGTASRREIRSVIAWSSVPMVLYLFILIPAGAKSIETNLTSGFDAGLWLKTTLFTNATGLLLLMYQLNILLAGLSEVNHFSYFKASASSFILLPFILLNTCGSGFF